MKHKIQTNDKGVLELTVEGDLSGEELNFILDSFAAHAKNKPAYVLVDASKLGRARPESRRDALKKLKALELAKMGVYGVHNPYAKYVTRLAAKALGMPNLRFFDSRQEAEQWIRTND